MKRLSLSLTVAGILILATPAGVDSCAIGPPEPVFATQQRPADIAAFLKGRIGVIRPSFQRKYLIGAYRILSGSQISDHEAQSLYLSPPQEGADPESSELTRWMEARSQLAATRVALYSTSKSISADGHFWYFENCLDDAFRIARLTLEKRAALWGTSDQRTKEWLAAQDQVFENCTERPTPSIPPTPAAGMDPRLAQDRAYQIASAWFYASNWQKARDAFTEVAKDSASPWQAAAPYLIARTFVREGTVEEKTDALQQAARLLRPIADDSASPFQEAAAHLLDYVRLRIDPSTRLGELGALLMKPNSATHFAATASDFIYLYRRETERAHPDELRSLASSSDLADWMLEFEDRAPANTNHALEQWQKTGSPAWLIAALSGPGTSGDPESLVKAARMISSVNPAYESASYYGLLRDIQSGHRDDALQWADEILRASLTVSGRNLVRAERFRLSRNWDDFLRFATRVPEPKVELDDIAEVDVKEPPVSTGTAALLDQDATQTLNRRVPLTRWIEASQNSLLPPHIQLEIAEAAWVRAILLSRDREARTLMNRIRQLQPQATAVTKEYLAENDSARAHFDAIFLLLRRPWLRPVLLPADGDPIDFTATSDSGADHIDSFPVCRWSGENQAPGAGDPGLPADSPFLSAAEQKQGEDEWHEWNRKAHASATYLGSETVTWARAHRDDPRVPEALHLAVQASRRGCKDADTGTYSRQAFDLLHQRYPQSEWAARTKYWYK